MAVEKSMTEKNKTKIRESKKKQIRKNKKIKRNTYEQENKKKTNKI